MQNESTLDLGQKGMDTRGVALLTPLSLEDAKRVGRGFGLDVQGLEALELGSVNSNFRLTTADGQSYFARIYEEQGAAGAQAELTLLRELDRAGVPVTLPLRFSDGGDVAVIAGKALSVYRWQPGVHLCNAMVDAKKTEALGAALAKVHLATPRLSHIGPGRFDVDGIRARLDGIATSASRFAAEVDSLEAKLLEYASLRDPELPAGLIHGDLFRDNVLFRDGSIAALLDFESASFGPFVYDIAVCLLSWCYTDALRADCALGLLTGYHGTRPLSQRELEQLSVEGAIACLRFATTRISDFSLRAAPGEPPRRDYRRFLQRLRDIEAGMFRELVKDFASSTLDFER